MAQPPSTLHPYGLRHGARHCPLGDDPMPCFENYSEEVLFLEQASGPELEFPVFIAPFKCTVVALGITPDDTGITGADVDYMTLQFQNKGADGTGVLVMATKDFTLGVDVAPFDYDDFGAVANAALAKDDVISLQKINTGTPAPGKCESPDLIVRVLYKKAA